MNDDVVKVIDIIYPKYSYSRQEQTESVTEDMYLPNKSIKFILLLDCEDLEEEDKEEEEIHPKNLAKGLYLNEHNKKWSYFIQFQLKCFNYHSNNFISLSIAFVHGSVRYRVILNFESSGNTLF